ncbi:MAG: hypothetical protein EXR74_06225 [Bdellovibrionales bacterium]|nr:hypothetical protein [Bdellovibrionales bacterium]
MKKLLNPTQKSMLQNNLHHPPTLSSPQKTIALFIFSFVLGLTLLFFFSNSSITKIDSDSISHSTLVTSLSKGGYLQFQSEKKILRAKIAILLSSSQNETEKNYATNVALYLFPDLLPDSNFEKTVAIEQWAPLESAIEKKPRSHEARLLFDEMKSNIWNYENPKMDRSGLSLYGSETLKIYHELSAP